MPVTKPDEIAQRGGHVGVDSPVDVFSVCAGDISSARGMRLEECRASLCSSTQKV